MPDSIRVSSAHHQFFAATDSSVYGSFDSILGRQLYLGGSLKWLLGERRNYSVDAGKLDGPLYVLRIGYSGR